MDWDDDPFEGIFREFLGSSRSQNTARRRRASFTEGEEEDRTIDAIETDDSIFLIFEFSGYGEKDISVNVRERQIEINAKKQQIAGIQEYLLQRLQQGMIIKKTLPSGISMKSFKHTFKNGILEVCFKKND